MKHTLLRRTSMLNAIGGIGKPPKASPSVSARGLMKWQAGRDASEAPGPPGPFYRLSRAASLACSY